MASKKRGLGRGLDALLGGENPVVDMSADVSSEKNVSSLQTMAVDKLQRGQYQPRREMNEELLNELADSIREQGIMQPLVVRAVAAGNYEIVAGERRWRAAQIAGLHEVPVIVRELSDESAIAMALIENIQRENLNPMEESIALDRLKNEFELTQADVAKAVGKSRAAVANLLRLMALNEDVKQLLDSGSIDLGHAKLLLALQGVEQSQAAREVAQRELTVRETEVFIKRIQAGSLQTASKKTFVSPDVERLQQDLSEKVGLAVVIQQKANGKGKLVVAYNSLDELDGLLDHIK